MKNNHKHNLRTPDQQRRLNAVDAAAILSDRCSVAEIIKVACLLNHPDTMVREGAVNALIRIGGSDAASQVARLVTDPDAHMRAVACEALGRMRALAEKNKLYDSLNESDPYVRCAAAAALRAMGDTSGLPTVITLLRSKGKHQIAALRGLNEITGKGFSLTRRGIQEALRWIRLTRQKGV